MSVLSGKATKRERLKDLITENIINGTLAAGERILPVHKLAKELKSSTNVVYQALTELVDEEFIECRGIRGFYVKEIASLQTEKAEPSEIRKNKAGKCFLSCGHHSDLVWKWDYKTYEKIREKQFDFLASMFRKYPKFHAYVEQAETIECYLNAHPEMKNFFQKAHKEGRFTLTGGGSIPDINLCSGETIVRIIQRGKKYYADTFGEHVEIDNREDSFGMNGQLPQILLKSGYRFLHPGRLPNFPEGIPSNIPFLWKGIDGSVIPVAVNTASINPLAQNSNAPYVRTPMEKMKESLHAIRNFSGGDALVFYITEVQSLMEEVVSVMGQVNAEQGNMTLEFGSISEFCKRLDPNTMQTISGEFNPIFTGCYTTRIGVKQNFRLAENLLFAAEMLSAGTSVPGTLSELWHTFEQTAFHDSLCGCHHDKVNIEIREKLQTVQNGAMNLLYQCAKTLPEFTVFNPGQNAGKRIVEFQTEKDFSFEKYPVQRDGNSLVFCPELPACGILSFQTKQKKTEKNKTCEPVFKTRFFEVDFRDAFPKIKTESGVLSEHHFGEILFRHDPGSMWSERYGGDYYGYRNQTEQVVSCVEGPVFYRVETEGSVIPSFAEDGADCDYWHGFGSLKFRKIYRFYRELNYFTVKIILDWSGENTKISVRFPLNLNIMNANGTYTIPFASTIRSPYYEVKKCNKDTLRELTPQTYQHAGGDWPTLHWTDYSDLERGCAVANSGTPGHQCVNGDILVSLLRSGTMILDGTMRPQEGALDNGIHEYEFAILPHSGMDRTCAIVAGEVLNRKPIMLHGSPDAEAVNTSFFVIKESNPVVSSLRATETGIRVRLYETLGLETRLKLPCPEKHRVWESDLQEKDWKKHSGTTLEFAPFEIKTIEIRKE